MALNKAQTSMGVKVILIFLIVAFVASFIPLIGDVFSGGTTDTTAKPGTVEAVNLQFQPTVSSLTAMLQSEPESYTVLVNLGNTYFDWAAAVQEASQSSSATVGADAPLWVASKDAYRRALLVKKDEPPVVVDYAIAAFYSGETSEAIKAAESVVKTAPEFAPAHYNLGIFYKALGQTAKAIAAFEQYLKLDPEGNQGNPDFARGEIETLKGASTPTTTP